MRIVAAVGMALMVLSACAEPETRPAKVAKYEPWAPPMSQAPEERARNIQAADDRMRRREQERKARAADAEAGVAGAKAAYRKKLDDAKQAEADACTADREPRIRHMAERAAEIDRRRKLDAWAEDHCKWEDRGKDIVYNQELPNGQIIRRNGHSTNIVRVCNAKEPADLPKGARESAMDGFPSMPAAEGLRNMYCKEYDLAAGVKIPCAYTKCFDD